MVGVPRLPEGHLERVQRSGLADALALRFLELDSILLAVEELGDGWMTLDADLGAVLPAGQLDGHGSFLWCMCRVHEDCTELHMERLSDATKKEADHAPFHRRKDGRPCWARTSDQRIMSPLL